MQQAKICKCNWESYDMVANPSVDMKALIITNRRVFGFIKRVDKSIRFVVLVDVVLNVINITSVATYFSHVRSGNVVFCTCFLLMQIAQVLILGLFANDIIVQSRATAADLYNINWHYLDLKNRKMFLMMLMQYQHVSVISIGPFGPMTVESVITVFKTAYMMLMRTYK
ncbi:hypothetical protein HUJ05_001531 [Dendroctonus ponderosae]|nr:hypothetical protein HUJ05_001531 [Dendroctonus ponderosae]